MRAHPIRLLRVVLVILACCLRVAAAPKPVPWKNHALTEVHTLKELPDALRTLITAGSPIADRGWPFNGSDVVDKTRPMRRFVLAGIDRSSALVAIEHGGFAYYVEAQELEFSNGKWTRAETHRLAHKPEELQDLVNQISAKAPETKASEPPVERKPLIFYSAAPWDGAAYELQIPQEKSTAAPDPAIRIFLWGNPTFDAPQTIAFTGKEDSGGGPGKGNGRASYQTAFNQSLPDSLSGTITFKSLQKGKPVEAAYDLTSEKGARFKGTFSAAWGNQSAGPIR